MQKRFLQIGAGVCAIAVCVMLFGCNKKPQATLPTGTLTFTGSLVKAELSLTRSGTHILRQNGHDALYVESSTVNLRDFEGMDVTITGTLQQNSDPSAQPVIVADSVSLIQMPSRQWSIPSLHMSFAAPTAWQGTMFTDGISFTETGTVLPVAKIYAASIPNLPTGTPLVVGGQGAVKTTTASGDVIYIQNGTQIIALQTGAVFHGQTSQTEKQRLEYLLKSVTFTGSPSSFGSGTTIHTGSGSAGMPCGGIAGILCPQGSYCAITDRASGIGICQPLSH